MFKELWEKIRRKQQSGDKLTRKEQMLTELARGAGTAKQLSDRTGIKLSIVRTTLSQLHKSGKIKDSGVDAGNESVWEVVN